MKKVIAAVVAMALASPALAGNVGVEFGTNWYKVNYTDNTSDNLIGQAQNFTVLWTTDDIGLGAYVEDGTWIADGSSTYDYNLTAIQVTKGLVKNVSVGMNLGSMNEDWSGGGDDQMVTDVFGSVILLGGTGNKITGTVKATIGGRFAADYQDGYDFSGLVVNLSVGFLF